MYNVIDSQDEELFSTYFNGNSWDNSPAIGGSWDIPPYAAGGEYKVIVSSFVSIGFQRGFRLQNPRLGLHLM